MQGPAARQARSPRNCMTASCPVCASRETADLDEGFDAPVLMNRLYANPAEARAAPRGHLAFAGCRACGFVWNRAFEPEKIVYDGDYENDQTHSPAFAAHVEDRARDVIAGAHDGIPIDFLEVGCGQGGFIATVARIAGGRLRGAEGFDPAWRGADGEGPAGSRIHKCYLDKHTASRLALAPNVVASRHTIEHIPDPPAFLRTIRQALGTQSRANLFIETPCAEWILERGAVQDFFYEHCSIFTARSLALALRNAGFASPHVTHVFGGQYLWARAGGSHADEAADVGPAPPLSITNVRRAFLARWRDDLAGRAANGPVALWGAGAKGVNFALLADPAGRAIDCVIDVNPAKQGKYLAGSGLPVVAPAAAATRKPASIYVMNPNYLGEIRAQAAQAGLAADLIPIN